MKTRSLFSINTENHFGLQIFKCSLLYCFGGSTGAWTQELLCLLARCFTNWVTPLSSLLQFSSSFFIFRLLQKAFYSHIIIQVLYWLQTIWASTIIIFQGSDQGNISSVNFFMNNFSLMLSLSTFLLHKDTMLLLLYLL
jgi:hypothetical protein